MICEYCERREASITVYYSDTSHVFGRYCINCVSNIATQCRHCGNWFNDVNNSDSVYFPLCDDCVELYSTCDNCGRFYYGKRCRDCRSDLYKSSGYSPAEWTYHTTPDDNRVLIGVELEVASDCRDDAIEAIAESLNESYEDLVYFKSDTSIESDEGFELCIQPCSWSYYKRHNIMDRISDILYDNNCESDSEQLSCGLHFHVNKESLSQIQINRIAAWMSYYRDELCEISRRDGDMRWCHVIEHSLGGRKYENDDRYSALNTQPSNTVEFRFFGGTTDANELNKSLDFIHNLVELSHNRYDQMIQWSPVKLYNRIESV